jgi:glycosyltransferase involved in cell wall biosynthesis
MSPKLLYFVTEDWYFCSHRFALAKAAQQQGFSVSVLTSVNQHGDIIRSAGFNLIELKIDRGGINPLRELRTLYQIWQVYRQLKPDIAHHVALKPVLYGGLVTSFFPAIKSVNLIAGLGSIFSSHKLKASLLRPIVVQLLRRLFRRKNSHMIVQNEEDYRLLINRLHVPPANVNLIKGSGVDCKRFSPMPEPSGQIRIALVSRMLWDKGVGEYVSAVKMLKQNGLDFTALLVGEPDMKNLAAVPISQLQAWQQESAVQWLGFVEDIAGIWRDTHIAVLPSYREGLPKSLLEAAACAKPIVTTDTGGCREVVHDGISGLLVPVRDAKALAEALEKLILDAKLRQTMGAAGRKMVENEFSDQHIIAQTMRLYTTA